MIERLEGFGSRRGKWAGEVSAVLGGGVWKVRPEDWGLANVGRVRTVISREARRLGVRYRTREEDGAVIVEAEAPRTLADAEARVGPMVALDPEYDQRREGDE